MRELTIADIDDLALGATLLGTGGGRDPYVIDEKIGVLRSGTGRSGVARGRRTAAGFL